MKHITFLSLTAGLMALLSVVVAPQANAGDVLGKYKLNLSDTAVCKVYYTRAGKWQAADSLVVGKKSDGITDSIHEPYVRLPYATDGMFVDSRGVGGAQKGDYDRENFVGANQGFLVFDFGEKGIDFMQVKLYNDGYFKAHQQTTVFVGLYGDCSKETYTDKDLVKENYNGVKGLVTDLLRTNGKTQKFSNVTISDKWVTGSADPSENEPGTYMTTMNAGSHNKYRYVVVYDWSNYFYMSEVEIWGVDLKTNTYNDKQLELDRAIAQAESYATEFKMSDATAVAALNKVIDDAKQLLADDVKDETTLSTAVTGLTEATNTFMSAITYKLGENEFYCALSTPDGMYGLKLASEESTVGSYKGKILVTCDPNEALPFSVNKSKVINSQQAYQLSNENGVVIQTGSTLMLVNASQVTSSNPAAFIFTQRYSDGENALYDMKAGDYFYYIDNDQLEATATFPVYEEYTDILAYLFQLTPSEYKKTEEEAAVNFKAWEFNDAAKEVTEVYGDTLGLNAGKIMDGWRFNKWRSYTRLEQTTVGSNGYMVASVNNPYWDRNDTLKQTPLTPKVDEQSVLTDANNGFGLCREYGKYATRAAADPIDQIRDSSMMIIVNPIYCPYIAIKIAGTSENVDLSTFKLSFFIKKDGVEPALTMSNLAGRKGDVYYWHLTDCGFTVGQVGYSAQYTNLTNLKSTKDALVYDWIRTYESVEAIPEETIPAGDLDAIKATLPENPIYEKPAVGSKTVKYLTRLMTMVTAANEDVTEANKANIAACCDGDTLTAVAHGNYYVINLPAAIQDFYSLKVYYKGGNEYSTNVLFYTDSPLDITKDSESAYVPNGGGLWMHSAFSGQVTKGDGFVTLSNPDRKKYTYIAIKGDNDGNPLSMTELVLNYYEDADFNEYEAIEDLNFWTLSTNWASTRKDGKTALNDKGYLAVTSGSDNTKRGDIKNTTDKIFMQDHKVAFYVIELTNTETVQNFGDMKFGYTAKVAGFNADTAVVNEQILRKNTDQQYILSNGCQLVYFDLSTTNANVAYLEGQSGSKFNGTQKDAYKKALNAEDNLAIYNPNFTLIAKEASNFIIHEMGSAKDVATLIEYYFPAPLEDVNLWDLSTNFKSTRKDGKTELTADNTLYVTSGSDNRKRGDIKNTVDTYSLQDHKVVFYVCSTTDTIQNYNDMKFGYTALVESFATKAVVNEQVVRKNKDRQYILKDGSQLIYFDLSNTNANVAYYEGESSNKFDGTTKDSYKTALNAENDLDIYNVNFTLIAKANADFVISKMGTARSVDAMVEYFFPTPQYELGDINGDYKVNVGDMTGLVNIILEIPTEGLHEEVADVNEDGKINVGDCVALTNKILGTSNVASLNADGISARVFADDFSLAAGESFDMAINFAGAENIAAMQMDITLPAGLTFESARLAGSSHSLATSVLSNGSIRVLGYSSENAMMDASSLIVTVRANASAAGMGRVELGNILVAGSNAAVTGLDAAYATVTFSVQSGLESVMNEDSREVYNILGQKVNGENLRSGIYVINGKKYIVK